jgi:hypothetical protein
LALYRHLVPGPETFFTVHDVQSPNHSFDSWDLVVAHVARVRGECRDDEECVARLSIIERPSRPDTPASEDKRRSASVALDVARATGLL